ncbi:MAG: GGDEF domain-containing protein [Aminobacteriaceae bacterium]
MDNNTSFLFHCDGELNILQIFWYSPDHLVSPYQKKLGDLFSVSDMGRIDQAVKKALSRKDVLFCEGGFRIISPEAEVCLCMMSVGDHVLIHGIDSFVLEDKFPAAAVKDTIHRFMGVIRASDAAFMTGNENVVREQFERIQKLNSDLLNMQRQLKKANAMLNRLNKDLNNRLVKDALTGLVSRYQYRQEIEFAVSRAPGRSGIFTFIDLDDFKRINDTYGHRAGDIFLKEFADRLGRLPFDDLICMRIAGDEFGLYIHGYESVGEEDVQLIWDSIKERVLKEPVDLDGVKERFLCSAGMAVYGRDTEDIYELIEYADFAMYEAKKAGKNSFSQFDLERYREKSYPSNDSGAFS